MQNPGGKNGGLLIDVRIVEEFFHPIGRSNWGMENK